MIVRYPFKLRDAHTHNKTRTEHQLLLPLLTWQKKQKFLTSVSVHRQIWNNCPCSVLSGLFLYTCIKFIEPLTLGAAISDCMKHCAQVRVERKGEKREGKERIAFASEVCQYDLFFFNSLISWSFDRRCCNFLPSSHGSSSSGLRVFLFFSSSKDLYDISTLMYRIYIAYESSAIVVSSYFYSYVRVRVTFLCF